MYSDCDLKCVGVENCSSQIPNKGTPIPFPLGSYAAIMLTKICSHVLVGIYFLIRVLKINSMIFMKMLKKMHPAFLSK
jgi:hypothetical protein